MFSASRPGAVIVGVDEAGRGCWAGPVFAAAVILDPDRPIAGLNDSKKLSASRRAALFELICQQAVAFEIAHASAAEVDARNILQATFLAMQRALAGLARPVDWVLVDGNRLPPWAYAGQAVVGGDGRYAEIAAASILAKCARDRYCLQMDEQYPEYGFAQHKAYGTAQHQAALRLHGPCPEHRASYAPIRKLLLASADHQAQ